MVSFPGLGRRPVLDAGQVVEPAAGNSVVTRATPRTSFGGLRIALLPGTEPTDRAPSGSGNNRLQARDRHPYLYTGSTTHSDAPANGGDWPNPQSSGPIRPSLGVVNRDLTWQIGTDHTLFADNDGPFALTEVAAGVAADGHTRVEARTYPLGTQGDPWTQHNGGTPSLYRPYGARGYVLGPPVGSPLDGPQSIRGGRPHGRHSMTVPPLKQTRAGYAARVQMTPVRVNRPSNSKRAGQSYSQTVVHQGGSIPNPMPRQPTTRQPGMSGRYTR